MFYIYRSFSIAGWIAAAVFFTFLLGWYLIRGRHREREPRRFDVTPSGAAAEQPTPPALTTTETDAKHP